MAVRGELCLGRPPASGGGRTQVGEVAGEEEVSGMEAVRGQNETRGQIGKSLNLQEGGSWSVVSFSLILWSV